ncbi:MAG: hypothetical protein QGD90_13070 [Candidatus Hydrogenedentes bacterium]|nr:hypothetical protein [Candidatus Hydrogenedentota bacterium]
MTISETGSVQGWAERVERVEEVERHRVGVRAWAARGDNAQPGEFCLADAALRGNDGGKRFSA